jgi:hypothetical protein
VLRTLFTGPLSSLVAIHLGRTISDLISRLRHLVVFLLLSLFGVFFTRHALLVAHKVPYDIDGSCWATRLSGKYLALLVNNKDTTRGALRWLLESNSRDEAL